jgi:hypothetical protein
MLMLHNLRLEKHKLQLAYLTIECLNVGDLLLLTMGGLWIC